MQVSALAIITARTTIDMKTLSTQFSIRWCSAGLFLITYLSGAILSINGHTSIDKPAHPEKILEDVLSSLERMMNFFGKDYSSVNVDGLFGIRLGQGSVNQSVADCSKPLFRCPHKLVVRLNKANDYINKVAEHAMPYVEEQDPDYFRHFTTTVDGPYILEYHTEVIEDTPEVPKKKSKYDEEAGDKCLSSMMGLWDDKPKCTIEDSCWELMTEGNTNGYTITHQLLYFMVADKSGCVPEISQRLKSIGESSLRGHETKMCASILAEARQEVTKGQVDVFHQDLFLEQGVLCGVMGYQNFMTEEWVRMVLSWQNDAGCFDMAHSLSLVENKILKLQRDERKLMRMLQQEAEDIDRSKATRSKATGRKLMREQVMEGDCLAHKTGLAFGLVSAYIRHYVRLIYGPPDLQ